MSSISLKTAEALTGLSRRTLWRRIGDGRLSTLGVRAPGEKTLVRLSDVLPLACIPLDTDDHARILAADAGHAPDQCDLGLTFLSAYRPHEAVNWFVLAAKQQYPDAAYWLGRCYLLGEGIARDEDTGLSWLGQAAVKGHRIAQKLLLFLQTPQGQMARAQSPASALETIWMALEAREILSLLKPPHSA